MNKRIVKGEEKKKTGSEIMVGKPEKHCLNGEHQKY